MERYFDEYIELLGNKRKRMDFKFKPTKIFFKGYYYNVWPKNEEESTDREELTDKEEYVDLSDKPRLWGDEKGVKQEKGLKNVT